MGRASAAHLATIRDVVGSIAEEAGLRDPEAFAHSWRRAKAMGRALIERYR